MSFKIKSQAEINSESLQKAFSKGVSLNTELEKGRKAHPVGFINNYGEQKQGDGTWKYVGKQNNDSQAGKQERQISEISDMLAKERVTDIQKRVGKTFETGVQGETMKILKVESMNTTVSINGVEKKIPNDSMMKRFKSMKEKKAESTVHKKNGTLKTLEELEKKAQNSPNGKLALSSIERKRYNQLKWESDQSKKGQQKDYSLNDISNAVAKLFNPKKGLEVISDIQKESKEDSHSWDSINTILTKKNWSPKHLAMLLTNLKKS